MKACEQCHLRYPDESTFCFVDGKSLVPDRTEQRVIAVKRQRGVVKMDIPTNPQP